MLLTSFYASSLVSIWVSLTSGFRRTARKRIDAVDLHYCVFFPASQAVVASRDRFSHTFNPGVVRWVRRAQKPVRFLHSNNVVVIQQAEVEPFLMMLNRVSCLCPNDGPSLPPQVMQVLAWVVSTVLLKFLLSTVLCASDDVRVQNRQFRGWQMSKLI